LKDLLERFKNDFKYELKVVPSDLGEPLIKEKLKKNK